MKEEYTMPESVTIDRDFLMKILNQIKSLSERIDVLEKRMAVPSKPSIENTTIPYMQEVPADVNNFFDREHCHFTLSAKFPDHVPLVQQQAALQNVLSNIKSIIESYGLKNIDVKYIKN